MWVFFPEAMLSIVQPKAPTSTDFLLVRGRAKGDIERVFPSAVVMMTPERDYRFRALIGRQEVALAIARRVAGIDYGNFKGACREDDRHDAYMDVWTAMFRFQGRRAAPFSNWWERDGAEQPGLPLTQRAPRKRGGSGRKRQAKGG